MEQGASAPLQLKHRVVFLRDIRHYLSGLKILCNWLVRTGRVERARRHILFVSLDELPVQCEVGRYPITAIWIPLTQIMHPQRVKRTSAPSQFADQPAQTATTPLKREQGFILLGDLSDQLCRLRYGRHGCLFIPVVPGHARHRNDQQSD